MRPRAARSRPTASGSGGTGSGRRHAIPIAATVRASAPSPHRPATEPTVLIGPAPQAHSCREPTPRPRDRPAKLVIGREAGKPQPPGPVSTGARHPLLGSRRRARSSCLTSACLSSDVDECPRIRTGDHPGQEHAARGRGPSELDRHGARGNRAFCVIDGRDRMVNAKNFPKLQTVRSSYDLEAGELALTFPDGAVTRGSVRHGEQLTISFFSHPCPARPCSAHGPVRSRTTSALRCGSSRPRSASTAAATARSR